MGVIQCRIDPDPMDVIQVIQTVQRNCDEPGGKRGSFEGLAFAAPQKNISEYPYFMEHLSLIHRINRQVSR